MMPTIVLFSIFGITALVVGVALRIVLDDSAENMPPSFIAYILIILGLGMLWVALDEADVRSEKITAHCFHHKEEILHRSPDKIQDLDATCIEIFKRYYTSNKTNNCGE